MPDPNPHLLRAIQLKQDGQYEPAMDEIRLALQDSPDCPEALHQMGLIQGFTGEFDESIATLAQAVQADPRSVKYRLDLALSYSMLGMVDEAKQEFNGVLLLDPGNDTATKNLAFFD
ncbi:MAG: hypothetical protein NT029_04795 [Armatimonadetes bacterium]|nr:hypothetical protein [Armatimonadota bacterium]